MTTDMEQWQPVTGIPGVWEYRELRVGVPLRAVAVALAGGELGLISPTPRMTGEAMEQFETLGRPTVALAPNHYHYLGIKSVRQRLPELPVVASETASPRLHKKLGIELQPLDVMTGKLPEHVELIEPPGTKNGEVWLAVHGPEGTAWIVTDAFFNLERHPPGPMGLLCRAMKISAGLRIGSSWRWMALSHQAAYRQWLLDTLQAAPPATLIMSHGEIVRGDDLGERLVELVTSSL